MKESISKAWFKSLALFAAEAKPETAMHALLVCRKGFVEPLFSRVR